VEELADTGAVNVLAHPDLAKVAGHRPAAPDEFYDRIAEAARSCGLATELNSAGWRKPCAEAYPAPRLQARLCKYGVPVTTGSGRHRLEEVAWRISDRPGCRVLASQRVPRPEQNATAAVIASSTIRNDFAGPAHQWPRSGITTRTYGNPRELHQMREVCGV
jgi:hypothetical protein